MADSQTEKTTHEKVSLFRSCFMGLEHVYGTYDLKTGQVRQVKQPVTYEVILRHLQGRQPYGVYLLVDDRTRAVVADFDEEDTFPPLEFVRQASQYGIKAYIERSKRKGWHAWVFMELPGVPASKARLAVKAILDDIGKPSTEIFPKQDRLRDNATYGNFINAPLFGRLVPSGRTAFVDHDDSFRPFPNQWDFLEGIERVSEDRLDEIIEINELALTTTPADSETSGDPSDISSAFGLPPCAQKMLAEGVCEYQRVACFRLAVHLKKAGLPQDSAGAVLRGWAQKNHPTGDKKIITEAEIAEQTDSAYSKDYRACGCEDPAVAPYCHPSCFLRSHSQTGTQSEDIANSPVPNGASSSSQP